MRIFGFAAKLRKFFKVVEIDEGGIDIIFEEKMEHVFIDYQTLDAYINKFDGSFVDQKKFNHPKKALKYLVDRYEDCCTGVQ